MAWQMYDCLILENPAQVLVDDRFAGHAPLEELPLLTWVGIYTRLPHGDALWNPEEADALDALETDLLERLKARGLGWAVYVLRIATPGIREYYIYHGEDAETLEAAAELSRSHPEYRIESQTVQDPLWVQYRKYVGPLQEEESSDGAEG